MNFNYTQVELKEVLSQFSKRTGYNITYKTNIIPHVFISANFINQPIDNILSAILSPFQLAFKLVLDDQIIISKKEDLRKEIYISGRVIDSSSGEFIDGALIIDINSSRICYSNSYGYFTLQTKNENIKLQVRYIGYQSKTLDFKSEKNVHLSILLNSNNSIPEVIINSRNNYSAENRSQEFSIEEIKNKSSLLGEHDVIRTLQSLPGVSTGADGFGGMHVRGGSQDQNLVMMDDVPLYYSSHALGLLSIFNGDAIRNIKFYKDRFPVQYQNRLSSIVDIHHQDGNMHHWNIDAGVGILSSKILIDGPLVQNKLSILIGIRRTNIDPFIKELSSYFNTLSDKTGATQYYFYDVNAKINYKAGYGNNIIMSYYRGKDYYNEDKIAFKIFDTKSTIQRKYQNLTWSNELISLRHQKQLSKNIFLQNVIYNSLYKSASADISATKFLVDRTLTDSFLIGKNNLSHISERGITSTLDWQLNSKHLMKFGANYASSSFSPSLINFDESSFINQDILKFPIQQADSLIDKNKTKIDDLSFFVEDRMDITKYFFANIGLRYSKIYSRTKTAEYISPRLSVHIMTNKNSRFSLSYDRLFQSAHLISTNSLSLPSDIWIGLTPELKSQKANQLSVEYHYEKEALCNFTLATYYKQMNNLVHLRNDANFNIKQLNNFENQFTSGSGKSYGLEASLHSKVTKQQSYYLNYCYSHTIRLFSELNQGKPFNYKYDRPHQIRLGGQILIKENCGVNFFAEYASGNPISLPLGQFTYVAIENDKPKVKVLVFDDVNNIRLPYIFRIDASMFYRVKNSWGIQEFTFGIYNILNRRNPQYIDIVIDPFNLNKEKYELVSIMPILPSISYRVTWSSKK